MEKIRVMIADDHAVVREGLRFLINTESMMELVSEAIDGQDAIDKIIQYQPDVVLLDLVMPLKSGIQVIEEIVNRRLPSRVLVLSSFSEDERVFPAIKAGAFGYLLKDTPTDVLIKSICEVYRGESAIHPTIARILIKEIHQPGEPNTSEPVFSEQEINVLRYIARGLMYDEISELMQISEQTIREDVSNILHKLHQSKKTQDATGLPLEGVEEDLQTKP